MKTRITLSCAAAALALCLLASATYAQKEKQPPQPNPRSDCYRRCDANNKKCLEEGKVAENTCTGMKTVCYGMCNDAFSGQ